jgi:pyruvate/2-oxoglutarate dehydrogenase complex dihydrolipoamide acyltransferase (E2) component
MKRRTLPHEMARTIPRLPAIYVQESNLSGLGFSLKPPKWVRKLTIKKVIKPLAITAAVVGAAFIPGALPLLGKGVGLLAKGAIGAGKFAGKRIAMPLAQGFMSRFKKPAAAQGAQTQAQYDAEQAAANQAAQAAADQAAANAQAAQNAANQAAQDAANRAAQAAQDAANQAAASQGGPAPPTYAPQSAPPSYSGGGGGGGGGYSAPATAEYGPQTEAQAAAQAGMGNSMLIPIGIGLVALIAVSGALKRRR